jgi:2,3-bisphosphoglycerate-independent phosphoglycerate mutase
MKYVIIRCEDRVRVPAEPLVDLLQSTKAAHLHHMAQTGAIGSLRWPLPRTALDGFHAHWALLGYSIQSESTRAGRAYAAAVDHALKPDEVAWCCDFVTQHEGRVVDPTAGAISTQEAKLLIEALNRQFGSEDRRWLLGEGSQHVLLLRDPALAAAGLEKPLEPPARIVGVLWKRRLPKGSLGRAVRTLVDQTSRLLEIHEVNRVRVDLRENPANMMWLWGAAKAHTVPTLKDHSGLSGVIISSVFPMRGFASMLGCSWEPGAVKLDEPSLKRLNRAVPKLLAGSDLLYLHVAVDASDPVERLCAVKRLDAL